FIDRLVCILLQALPHLRLKRLRHIGLGTDGKNVNAEDGNAQQAYGFRVLQTIGDDVTDGSCTAQSLLDANALAVRRRGGLRFIVESLIQLLEIAPVEAVAGE